MKYFVSASIILPSLIIVAFLSSRLAKGRESQDFKIKLAAFIFVCEALLVICELFAGGDVFRRLPHDMTICIIGLSAVTSSIWTQQWVKGISYAVIAVLVSMSVYALLAASGVAGLMSERHALTMFLSAFLVFALLQSLSLWWRIRDVRAVMKSGTVWQALGLSVDSMYVSIVYAEVMLYLLVECLFPAARWHLYLASATFAAATFAFGFRILNGSLFVLLSRHERRIVESMKISHIEVANDDMKENEHYREIYDRVVAYFEESLPYLNSNLTINDVVKVVFTNKLYISRAISQYTGRNFCQFVNYHRVTYSVNLFRKNPEMKITDLANASGFNTVVSFSMAFKLFMNENPSDWCRKEKFKLIKGKNKLWNP